MLVAFSVETEALEGEASAVVAEDVVALVNDVDTEGDVETMLPGVPTLSRFSILSVSCLAAGSFGVVEEKMLNMAVRW